MKQFTECALIAIVGLIGGFYLGRQSVKPQQEEIRYVKGDTIERTVAIEIPYQVEIPSNPILIYKTDTLVNTIVQKVDTVAILNDWITKREYKQNLFDDSNGKLSIDASIQYNQLQTLSYSFIPIEKQIISTRKPVWTPFVEASYSTLNYIGLGGGIFYHDLGLSVKYVTDFDKNGWDFGLKYKF